MPHKQPKGQKDTVKIQIQERIPIPAYKKYNIPKKFLKNSDMMKKVFRSVIILDVYKDKTRDAVVHKIHEIYGPGEYNICAYNLNKRNKKYSKEHECIGVTCKYYQNKKCGRYSIYKKGQACRNNPKKWPNWDPYARVQIFAADNNRGYDYKWLKKFDKMHRFWFWKA